MILIRNGRLVNAAGRRAEPADILVTGDTIAEVGPAGAPAPPGARVLDASGLLLIPGLINAHTHSHGNLSRGMGDRWTLELLLNAGPWLSGHRAMEDKHVSALIGAVEMVRKGVTACYDLFYEFPAPSVEGLDAVGRAYAAVGMRAVVAPMMADRTFYEAIPGLRDSLPPDLAARVDRLRLAPWPESLAATRAALAGWTLPREQVTLAIAPTIPLHCSDAFLTGCRDLSAEFDVGLHMHLAESKAQAVSGLAAYGRTLTAHLQTLGLLGPRFTAAHAIWLDEDEIRRLGDCGASVAHNPGSNLRLGSGIAPVRRMREAGVHVGIGTDAASCSDNLNMFEAMRLASFVSRVQGPDHTRWLTTDEAFWMATEGSARALGWDGRIGRIAPGFKADIVFLDEAAPHFVPLNDVTNQIVHGEDGTGVVSVMIGGRLVVDRGRLTTVDTDGLRRRAAETAGRLAGLTGEARALAERLETVVARFCQGLATRPHPVQRYAATTPS